MKHIKQVQARNWQGGNINHQLARLTIIGGENQVGKSAIAALIRVGLIGYSPAHGKKPADTFGFAGARDGASSTRLELTVSDGTSIWHEWTKKKSITYKGENPFTFPPVLLDVREYLGRSGPDKVRYVFDRIDLAALGFDLDTLTARLKREVKPKEVTKATEAALGQLIDDVGELDEQRHDLQWTLQAWIEAVIAKVKADRDEAQAIVEQMTGTIQGTSSLAGQENAKPITFDRDDLETARKKVATLDAQIRDGVRLIGEITEREDLRDELTAKVAETVDHTAAIAEADAGAAALEARVEAFTSPLQSLLTQKAQAEADRTSATTEIERMRRELDLQKGIDLTVDHTAEITKIEAEAAALDQKVEAFTSPIEKLVVDQVEAVNGKRNALALAEGLRQSAKALQAEMDADLACPDCPTCHSKGEAWKAELRSFMEAKIAEQVEAARAKDRLAAEYELHDEDLSKKIKAERLRVAERDEWNKDAHALRLRASDLRSRQETINAAKTRRDTMNEAVVRYSAKFDAAGATLAEVEPKIEVEQARVKDRDEWSQTARTLRRKAHDLRDAQSAYTTAKAKLDALPPRQGLPDLSPVEAQLHAAQVEVVRLEEVERAFIRQQSDLARAEEARQKRTTAEAAVEVCKLALKVIEAEKADMMNKAFGGFMGKVQMFTAGIMTDRDGNAVHLEYRDGEIGYFYGATWVGLEYFSGTQELLTFAGLSVALATTAPIKIVIMDELGRLSSKTMARLLSRVRELLAGGAIDQFIGISASVDGYTLNDGESVLRLA